MANLSPTFKLQFFDGNGDPASGYLVYFWTLGGMGVTAKDTYQDKEETTTNTNPIVLNARGETPNPVFLSGFYDVQLKDASGVLVYQVTGVSSAGGSGAASANDLVPNGSFETDSDGDGVPDSWVRSTVYSGGTVTVETSDGSHGAKSVKFLSTGSGGGVYISDAFIPVTPARDYRMSFQLRSSVVDVRNLVEVYYYTGAEVYISAQTIYDESAANPLVWTLKEADLVVPATAKFCKIQITGCHSSDATPGHVFIDDVSLVEKNYNISGTSVTTWTVNRDGSKGIFDPSANTADRTYTMQDASGTVAFTTDAPAVSFGLSGYANAIINGDFSFWDYGTTVTAPATNKYVANRWVWINTSTAVVDVIRTADYPTEAQSAWQSTYCMKVDCTTADAAVAAGDLAYICQRIEGKTFLPLLKRTGYLTFWVKSPKTGTHCVAFQNSGQDRSYVIEYTVSVADTWERKTMSLSFSETGGTWDYTTGVGLRVIFPLIGGSTYQTTADAWQTGNYVATANQQNLLDNVANNFLISQVDLRPSNATPASFVGRPLNVEKDMCARYYEILGGSEGTIYFRGASNIVGMSLGGSYHYYPKRATPTATKSGTWTVASMNQPTLSDATINSIVIVAVTTAAPAEAYFHADGADDVVTLDAEL